MGATSMLRPIEAEYLRRNPGVTVTGRTGQNIPSGHAFDKVGRVFGEKLLDRGILDKGSAKTAKASETKNQKPTIGKRNKAGRTVLAGPLSSQSQGGAGSTYRKKLLGD